MNVIQAAPGTGKTAFCLQTGSQCGFPTVYVRRDVAEETLRRVVAVKSKTPLGDIGSLRMNREQLQMLATDVATKLTNFVILDGTLYSARCNCVKKAVVDARSRRVKRCPLLGYRQPPDLRHNGQLMGGYVSEYDAIAIGIRNLTELAGELGCAVLIVSHRNRAGQAQGGLHASKGSGDIEYAAECVLELDVAQNAKPDAANEKPVGLRVLKNRHGPTGKRNQTSNFLARTSVSGAPRVPSTSEHANDEWRQIR